MQAHMRLMRARAAPARASTSGAAEGKQAATRRKRASKADATAGGGEKPRARSSGRRTSKSKASAKQPREEYTLFSFSDDDSDEDEPAAAPSGPLPPKQPEAARAPPQQPPAAQPAAAARAPEPAQAPPPAPKQAAAGTQYAAATGKAPAAEEASPAPAAPKPAAAKPPASSSGSSSSGSSSGSSVSGSRGGLEPTLDDLDSGEPQAQAQRRQAAPQASPLPPAELQPHKAQAAPAAPPAAPSPPDEPRPTEAPEWTADAPGWSAPMEAATTMDGSFPPETGVAQEPASQQVPEAAAPPAARPPVQQAAKLMDIVFVSAEVAPWSKTGGLGDVVGSLPIALAARGHRVMVIAPRYQHGDPIADARYAPAKSTGVRAGLDLGHSGHQTVEYYHLHQSNVDWVFVDHPCYHRPGNPYADEHGAFGDNQFRYALLSLAACEAPLQLHIGGYRQGQPPGFPYGDRVLFMANDWHAALVPAYIAGKYRRHGVYKDARCIVAIHNLSHQGVDPASTYANLGLPDDWYDPLSWEFPSWAAITGPAVNILKGGVAVADRIVTVSQGYAWEITTAEGGWGMDGILKSRQAVLNGIANGVDTEEWDPSTDPHIAQHYSAADLSGKAACKRALQRELGWREDADRMLIGFIGRLDFQKGPDLVLDAVPGLVQRNCQVIMLGSGVEEYETRMRQTEAQYGDHFRGWVGFSIPVAHRIIAGCDVILMPSRFEPCGLNQLFAMRYGTVPIAHATGGLRDTIEDFNPFAIEGESIGTGWTYSPCDLAAMFGALDLALQTYHGHRQSWEALMRSGMGKDLTWDRAAQQYEQIFEWALMDPPARAW